MDDMIDKIMSEKVTRRTDVLVQVGLYLEPDISNVLDELGRKGGRGARSQIVNDALRKYFKERDLL